MKVEQFVVAYHAEQDRLRALLPKGYESLRPVLRINAEIHDEKATYLELNTPVASQGKRGWLNIANWKEFSFSRNGKAVTFKSDFLQITFSSVGIEGGCPAEKDNDECFFIGEKTSIRLPETIESEKEFCDCEFAWSFTSNDAHGKSIGKTLPAFPTEPKIVYKKEELSAQNAALIPCEQVLGSYMVIFDRK